MCQATAVRWLASMMLAALAGCSTSQNKDGDAGGGSDGECTGTIASVCPSLLDGACGPPLDFAIANMAINCERRTWGSFTVITYFTPTDAGSDSYVLIYSDGQLVQVHVDPYEPRLPYCLGQSTEIVLDASSCSSPVTCNAACALDENTPDCPRAASCGAGTTMNTCDGGTMTFSECTCPLFGGRWKCDGTDIPPCSDAGTD